MPKPSAHFHTNFSGLIFILALLFPVFLFAQSEEKPQTQSFGKGEVKNGRKEGVWKFFYPNGNLMAEETYLEGELNGKAVDYYPDGVVSSIENWKEDLLEDSAWYFHQNGKLNRKGRYEKGVYQGFWVTYSALGFLEQSGFYVDGLPEGEFINWYDSGNLKEKGTYSGGKKEGQFVFYYDRKKERIELLAYFKNDAAAGLWISFKENGKLKGIEKKSDKQVF